MALPKIADFTVDIERREVGHKSGAVVIFAEYPAEDEWGASGEYRIQNPDLFDGSERALAQAAKRAALLAGMNHKKPVPARST